MMKHRINQTTHLQQLLRIQCLLLGLVMLFSVIIPSPAQASVLGKVKDAGKAVKKTAKKTGKKVKKTAKKVVKTTKKTAKKGGEAVKETTKKAWKNTKNITHSASKAVKKGLDKAKKGFNKVKGAVLNATFKKAADKFIKEQKEFILAFEDKMNNLDDEGLAARDAIIKELSDKKTKLTVSKSLRKNMEILGEKFGLLTSEEDTKSKKTFFRSESKKNSSVKLSSKKDVKDTKVGKDSKKSNNSILPKKFRKSCFGICVSGGGAYGISGEGSIALVMNTFKKGKSYPIALVAGGDIGIGAQIGGSVNAGAFWSPGEVATCDGAEIGVGMEIAAGAVGLAIGLSWDVSKDMFKKASNVVPGFSLSWSAGVEVKAFAATVGYSKILKTFK